MIFETLLVDVNGDSSTAVGYQALKTQNGINGTVGNTAVGYQTLDGILTGAKNTALGAEAMGSADGEENENVAVGIQ